MPAHFPERRLRRLRRTPALRRMVAESRVTVDDLMAPLFVGDDLDEPVPVPSMPGVVRHTPASLVTEAKRLASLGVPGVVLFGVTQRKDARGSEAWNPDGIVQRALSELRCALEDSMVLMADLCLDEYTDHGHCGVLSPDGRVDNDATIELYGRVAVAQATAGADLVAPSGMMDGQVRAIRAALDAGGFADTGIMAYAAKYASALYGPFRDAVGVSIGGTALGDGANAGNAGGTGISAASISGDRRSYQQDPPNRREAVVEVSLDVTEGADIVMVKPALAYLDVIAAVRAAVDTPVAAYHVSGEYAMVQAAAERGWIDGAAVAAEHVGAIKRAGADVILTYFAGMLAESLGG